MSHKSQVLIIVLIRNKALDFSLPFTLRQPYKRCLERNPRNQKKMGTVYLMLSRGISKIVHSVGSDLHYIREIYETEGLIPFSSVRCLNYLEVEREICQELKRNAIVEVKKGKNKTFIGEPEIAMFVFSKVIERKAKRASIHNVVTKEKIVSLNKENRKNEVWKECMRILMKLRRMGLDTCVSNPYLLHSLMF